MIENKKIYEAVQVINEYREKLMELCNEYCDKIREVCPEDISSKYHDFAGDIKRLTSLQFDDRSVTKKELEEAGYSFYRIDDINDGTAYYVNKVNGVRIVYCIDAD